MPYYKLYLLDARQTVIGRHERPYPDDEAAIAGAAAEFRGQTVEIWEGARCVLTSADSAVRQGGGDLHRPVDLLA